MFRGRLWLFVSGQFLYDDTGEIKTALIGFVWVGARGVSLSWRLNSEKCWWLPLGVFYICMQVIYIEPWWCIEIRDIIIMIMILLWKQPIGRNRTRWGGPKLGWGEGVLIFELFIENHNRSECHPYNRSECHPYLQLPTKGGEERSSPAQADR